MLRNEGIDFCSLYEILVAKLSKVFEVESEINFCSLYEIRKVHTATSQAKNSRKQFLFSL